MKCLNCEAPNTHVVETRHHQGCITTRKHTCHCGARWQSTERPDRVTLTLAGDPSAICDTKPHANSTLVGYDSSSGSGSLDLFPDLLRISSKPPKQRDSNMMSARLIGAFAHMWGAKYGKEYRPTAEDKKAFAAMLKSQVSSPEDIAELEGAWRNYLADLSEWVSQSHRHSLFCFCKYGGFNKYRVVAPIVSKREAATIAAGEQWLAMHEGGGNGRR